VCCVIGSVLVFYFLAVLAFLCSFVLHINMLIYLVLSLLVFWFIVLDELNCYC